MIDWTKSMKQTYEYYVVNPNTFSDERKLNLVKSSTISRDASAETLGSLSMDIDEPIGECYVRVYLVVTQNRYTEKIALGTFLVQTTPSSFDGKQMTLSVDGYTPLLELKENAPPIGYFASKDSRVMNLVYACANNNMRAPVSQSFSNESKFNYDFVADQDDTWLSYIISMAKNANYHLELDAYGTLYFSPDTELDATKPIWTYTDDNSSILRSDVSIEDDLYGIPNVVELVLTERGKVFRAENRDSGSPVSIQNRGREIIQREIDPEMAGNPSDEEMQQYADRLLKQKSTLQYTVTYTHGYCPVKLGDCVLLNYRRAGFNNIKGFVISQSIDCTSGCQVNETIIYTKKLWE